MKRNEVTYRHLRKYHSIEGAAVGLPLMLGESHIESLLDVGAGSGTWLRGATLCGVKTVIGIDGVPAEGREIWVESDRIVTIDLSKPFDLGRKFDVALCLEVAEHLPPDSAPGLVRSLCSHSDMIFFSAAVPGQRGQHHVNCQWPVYWQELFNQCGFVCEDTVRFKIWNTEKLEPWYKQNMFRAIRDDDQAGRERRLLSVVHPDMLEWMEPSESARYRSIKIERGEMSLVFYVLLLTKYVRERVRRVYAGFMGIKTN